MRLEAELKACVDRTPGCVAAGFVDLDMGMMLALQSVVPISSEDADILAVVGVEVLKSDPARTMEAQLQAPFASAVIAGDEILQIFQRIDGRPGDALYLVFEADIEAPLALAAARDNVAAVAGAGLW